jgi:predicted ferric reductase
MTTHQGYTGDLSIFFSFVLVMGTTMALLWEFRPSKSVSFVHRRAVTVWGESFTNGEALAVAAYVGVNIWWFIFWTNREIYAGFSSKNKMAKVFGHLVELNVSFLLFPVSRNSVWNLLVGVSHERLIKYHRIVGAAVWIFVTLHLAATVVDFEERPDVDTVECLLWQNCGLNEGMASAVSSGLSAWVILSVIVATAVAWVRARNYELFLAFHCLFVVFLVLAVVHSSYVTVRTGGGGSTTLMGYFLLPLVLYLVDVSIRLLRTASRPHRLVNLVPCDGRITRVAMMEPAELSVAAYHSPMSSFDIADRSGHSGSSLAVTHPSVVTLGTGSSDTRGIHSDPLSSVDSVEKKCRTSSYSVTQGARRKTFVGNKWLCKPGQFCYLNVSEISFFEWHPFSVSSNTEVGKDVTFHIKDMGDDAWTGKLHALAQEYQEQHYPTPLPTLSIDGPYGHPPQYLHGRHDAVVYIAGGIGITPCAAQLEELLLRLSNHGGVPNQNLRHVVLIWSTRDSGVFNTFSDLLGALNCVDSTHKCRVSVHIYNTQNYAGGGAAMNEAGLKEALASSSSRRDDLDSAFSAPRSQNNGADVKIPCIRSGRPDLRSVIADAMKDVIARSESDTPMSDLPGGLPYSLVDSATKLSKEFCCGVYVCGPTSLVRATEDACERLEKGVIQGESVYFDLHSEAFQVS